MRSNVVCCTFAFFRTSRENTNFSPTGPEKQSIGSRTDGMGQVVQHSRSALNGWSSHKAMQCSLSTTFES